jgi:hypothetical protein
VHLVWRNMSHPVEPGSRFSIYCLDYGSCLTVVRGTEKYTQNVRYYDIMEKIAVRFEQMKNFDAIITSDLFAADQVQSARPEPCGERLGLRRVSGRRPRFRPPRHARSRGHRCDPGPGGPFRRIKKPSNICRAT